MCWDDEEGSEGPGRGTERLPDKAAPIVPDESEKAVDELRPSALGQNVLHHQSGHAGTDGSVPISPYLSLQDIGCAKRYWSRSQASV